MVISNNGVGPHPLPWPNGPHYDPELLKHGDTRNVADEYRYMTEAAIMEAIQKKGVTLEIAIENLSRDFNMGTIVRSANAFGVQTVHIIGSKQWNKRGAMKTDAYLDIHYYASVEDFVAEQQGRRRVLIGLDTTAGAVPLHASPLPKLSTLVFGSEAEGLSDDMLRHMDQVRVIPQRGSTRSLNVGVAAGIAMYRWSEDNMLS